jgi:hypothetical protein
MYDDAKYGVITRKWFGLTEKHGGEDSGGYTFGTTDATNISQLARWYPKGPIRLVKFGSFALATITNASNDLLKARLLTRGASASVAASHNVKSTATARSQYTFASVETMQVSKCKAGEYLAIETATPSTDNGTAANTATTTGTVAFFVDYTPQFEPEGSNFDATG